MFRKWILLILILVVGVNGIQAHGNHDEVAAETHIGYYLKADANGVQQVYQQPLDGKSEARQLTHAASDVLTFGAAFDGLSVAYVSGGQLWLQPIHTEEAEALASVSAKQFFRSPVFSQDGQYVAYPDNGVWLLDLGTRQTRQLLANVDVKADGSNVGDYRLYWPEQFAVNADGNVTKLIVDVGVWEWNTVGVYDLARGDLQVLEGQVHTDLLPLSDGKVLLFGNSGVAGEPALDIADSLDDINTYSNVMKFGSLTNSPLFADQAVEIKPGFVRIFGQSITPFPDEIKAFYLDYDLTANVIGQLRMIRIYNESQGHVFIGKPTSNGDLLPVYRNAFMSEAGTVYGDLSLINPMTDETTAFDGTRGLFNWQP